MSRSALERQAAKGNLHQASYNWATGFQVRYEPLPLPRPSSLVPCPLSGCILSAPPPPPLPPALPLLPPPPVCNVLPNFLCFINLVTRFRVVFSNAIQEANLVGEIAKNALPIHGKVKEMNLNEIVLTNILNSPYFREECIALASWEEIITEIKNNVDNLEPYQPGQGNHPSSAFCILYRMHQLRPTEKQILSMINNEHNV